MKKNNRYQQVAKMLEEKLIVIGQEYELIERLSDQCVRVRFTGMFMDSKVVWLASIHTLQHKYEQLQRIQRSSKEGFELRQSIAISDNDDCYNIDIALNLKGIDESAIKRTIIMIRKYKRLHLGHHEYGETVKF